MRPRSHEECTPLLRPHLLLLNSPGNTHPQSFRDLKCQISEEPSLSLPLLQTETQPVPHLNPPHPRVPMPQRLLVQAIVLEESFQTALGLLELALLNDSAGERPQGPLIQGRGASLPSCLISACGRS